MTQRIGRKTDRRRCLLCILSRDGNQSCQEAARGHRAPTGVSFQLCTPGAISILRRHRPRRPAPMTYEEMVRHLLETYPPGDYRGDELMDYITAEIEAAEARGAITPEVREKVYRHFGITTSEHGGPG